MVVKNQRVISFTLDAMHYKLFITVKGSYFGQRKLNFFYRAPQNKVLRTCLLWITWPSHAHTRTHILTERSSVITALSEWQCSCSRDTHPLSQPSSRPPEFVDIISLLSAVHIYIYTSVRSRCTICVHIILLHTTHGRTRHAFRYYPFDYATVRETNRI